MDPNHFISKTNCSLFDLNLFIFRQQKILHFTGMSADLYFNFAKLEAPQPKILPVLLSGSAERLFSSYITCLDFSKTAFWPKI